MHIALGHSTPQRHLRQELPSTPVTTCLALVLQLSLSLLVLLL
jgi:hypothetical protein